MRHLFIASLVLACAAWWAAPLVAQTAAPEPYRIADRDRLQVRVAELPEVNSDLEVASDGSIRLPVVGTVTARGMTEQALGERIRNELLARGLRKATVTVAVTEARTRPVAVLGAVAAPGNVWIRGSQRLFDVLMEVGGVAGDHGKTIIVRRHAENGLADRLEIAVDDLVVRADPVANIPILAGDRINIPKAATLTYYFIGEVEGAGQQTFLSTEGETLLTAIARIGGLSDSASSRLRILRTTPGGERTEIVVDYKRILSGRDPDLALTDGDIIVVKEAFF